MPAPDNYIVKTKGTCEELSENHAHGIIFSLKIGETVERELGEFKAMLQGVRTDVQEITKDFRLLNKRVEFGERWQDRHEERERAAKEKEKAEAEKWEPIKKTAIQETIRWAVRGSLVLLASIIGAGVFAMLQSRLAQGP